MDQHSGSELPPVQATEALQPTVAQSFEAPSIDVGNERLASQAIEAAQSNPGQAPATSPLAPPAVSQQATALPQQAQPSFPGMPTIADDTDLIEKEWVLKAKEIVARTRHDPYQQNKQVESFKADYMKKRYNKDIKLTED